MRVIVRTALVATFIGLVTACGGSQHEAEEPSSKSSEEPEKAEPAGEKASDTKAASEEKSEGEGEGEEKHEEKKADEKPKRSAKDVITKSDSLYVYSFADSEPHQEAEKKCKAASKDDPKKTADCMAKASKGQDRDAYAFQENGDKVVWLTVSRKGGTMTTIHKVACDVDGDTGDKITLKPSGKDEGSKPGGGLPHELAIELDGESQIVINDPKLGRLVYQLKLGLMGKQER